MCFCQNNLIGFKTKGFKKLIERSRFVLSKLVVGFGDHIQFMKSYQRWKSILFQFEKPGSRDDFDYPEMAEESVKAALKDGGVSYQDIQQAYVGYVYGKLHIYLLVPSTISTRNL